MSAGFKRLSLKWIVFAAAAAFLLWVPTPPAVHAETARVGQPAPDFSLKDLSGVAVSLQEFRGDLVLVEFWATWCVPCRKSIPELADLERKYRDRNVVVLGLSVDDPDSYDDQYVYTFIKKYNVDYRILRADSATVDQYLGKDNPNVPTLFIIDRQGVIAEKHEGYTPGWLELRIQKFLE